jgi:hypothetical protein
MANQEMNNRMRTSPLVKEKRLPLDEKYLVVSKKDNYVFILWDVQNQKNAFRPEKSSRLKALRYGAFLAWQYGFPQYPECKETRFQMVCFKSRDEYGAPVWDSVEKLYAFTFLADHFAQHGITHSNQIWDLDENTLRDLAGKKKP